MKIFMIIGLFLMMAFPAFADQTDTVKELATAVPDISKSFGREVGLAIAETAKQLGVAVSDFANTNVGMLVMAILAWKLVLADMAASVANFIVGAVWLTVVYRKYSYYTTAERIDAARKDAGYGDFPYSIGVFIITAIASIPGFIFLAVGING